MNSLAKRLFILAVLISALAFLGPQSAVAAPDCSDCPGSPSNAGHSPDCLKGSACYGCWSSCRYSGCSPLDNIWQCTCPDMNPGCFS